MCGEKTEKAVFATFLSVFQIIPAASFVKITKSPETIVVSGLLTMVRGTGLEFGKKSNYVIFSSETIKHGISQSSCFIEDGPLKGQDKGQSRNA